MLLGAGRIHSARPKQSGPRDRSDVKHGRRGVHAERLPGVRDESAEYGGRGGWVTRGVGAALKHSAPTHLRTRLSLVQHSTGLAQNPSRASSVFARPALVGDRSPRLGRPGALEWALSGDLGQHVVFHLDDKGPATESAARPRTASRDNHR
jgi:hypothetical protein